MPSLQGKWEDRKVYLHGLWRHRDDRYALIMLIVNAVESEAIANEAEVRSSQLDLYHSLTSSAR